MKWFGHRVRFSPSLKLKAINFGLVGVINTLVDLSIFWIAWRVLGFFPLMANVLAWFVAISGSYAMNCLTTFSVETGGRVEFRTYGGFVASGVGGLLASTAVLFIATAFSPILVAKFVAIVASFAVNFSLSHFLIFRPTEIKSRRFDD